MLKKLQHCMAPIALASLLLFLNACAPMPAGQTVPPNTPAANSASSNDQTTAPASGATAKVTTRSLRVRGKPVDSAVVVAGIKEGETYDVLGISSDGLWVQLAIPDAPGGKGWVNANFVSVEGSISETTTTQAPVPSKPISGTVQSGSANAKPAAGFAVVKTGGTRLRVRSAAASDAQVIGYVYDGEQYQVLETSADGQWVKIAGSSKASSDNADGGWVAAQYLEIGQ